ncbi:MAG TPA: hypothetical protein VEU11_12590, partial [Terriglobales bacterium]|nr:hypothetical protein [Terriglobales bacterium]
RDLFVQDASAGIYVSTERTWKIRQGQYVEVTGITGPGEFAPVVQETGLRILGQGRLPQARKASLEELASGSLDSLWVEVSGTVTSAVFESNFLNLYLEVVSAPIGSATAGNWRGAGERSGRGTFDRTT